MRPCMEAFMFPARLRKPTPDGSEDIRLVGRHTGRLFQLFATRKESIRLAHLYPRLVFE
jgi:hypothetical protein